MRIKYTYTEALDRITNSGLVAFVSKLDDEFSYDISVGEVLFIRTENMQIIKLDYNFEEYMENANNIANYILKNWVIM